MKQTPKLSFTFQPLDDQVVFSINGFTVEICRERPSLNTAFRLRYRAYRKVEAIPENEEGLFYDHYDFLPNARTHLVWYEDRPVATVRGCIYSSLYDWQKTEELEYFAAEIREKHGNDIWLLESNRYAVDPDFQGRQSLFAQLLMFRVHGLNATAHACDMIITGVRSNHIPFYRRFLGMESLCEQTKFVPWIQDNITLMAAPTETCRQAALRRGMPDYAIQDVSRYIRRAHIPGYKIRKVG